MAHMSTEIETIIRCMINFTQHSKVNEEDCSFNKTEIYMRQKRQRGEETETEGSEGMEIIVGKNILIKYIL